MPLAQGHHTERCLRGGRPFGRITEVRPLGQLGCGGHCKQNKTLGLPRMFGPTHTFRTQPLQGNATLHFTVDLVRLKDGPPPLHRTLESVSTCLTRAVSYFAILLS